VCGLRESCRYSGLGARHAEPRHQRLSTDGLRVASCWTATSTRSTGRPLRYTPFTQTISTIEGIVDSRLRPCCITREVYLLIFIAEQNLLGVDAVLFRLLHCRYFRTHMTRHSPYVKILRHRQDRKYNCISQRCQRRTVPRPQGTCARNWWSSVMWFSRYASRQTDRQTDRQRSRNTQYNTSHSFLRRSNNE